MSEAAEHGLAGILSAIESAGGADVYPEANYVTVFEHVNLEYWANGDFIEDRHELTHVLTDAGKERIAILDYWYDARRETVDVVLARVINQDGTVTMIPDESIADISEERCGIIEETKRIIRLTVPDLDIGDAVEVRTQKTSRGRLENQFDRWFLFQVYEPIHEQTVSVTGPHTLPLQHHTYNGTLEFQEESLGERFRYTWTARQVPKIVREPSMPSIWEVGLVLITSTYGDWPSASRYVHEAMRDKVDMNEALGDKVREITDGLDSDDEKILAINHFVSKHIRYVGSSLDAGMLLEPHEATFTFEKGYGICRDKAILEIAMLKEVGIPAHMVGVNGMRRMPTEIPTLEIEHAIVGIPRAGAMLFLDPTMETQAELGETFVGGRHVLIVGEEGHDLYEVPEIGGDRNMGVFVSRSTVRPDGTLEGEVEVSGNGMYHMWLRDFSIWYPGEQMEMLLEEQAQAIDPRADISGITSSDPMDFGVPFTRRFNLRIPGYASQLGSYHVLGIPLASGPFDLSEMFFRGVMDQGERRYPYLTLSAIGSSHRDELTLPEGYRVRSLPQDIEIDRGPVSFRSRAWADEGVVRFESEFRLDRSRLTPDEVAGLREVLSQLDACKRGMIVLEWEGVDQKRTSPPQPEPKPDVPASPGFERKEPTPENYPDAAVVFLNLGTGYRLLADGSVEQRSTKRVKILSKDGRESYGNSRIRYDTSVDSLVLVRAGTVTPNGEFEVVDEGEINDLTPPEVAEALTYANTQMRVIPHPSVEPGSELVLEHEIFTHDPDANGLDFVTTFQTDEPIFEKEITVEVPRETELHYKAVGFNPHVDIEPQGEKTVYTIREENCPQLLWEYHMPAWMRVLPKMVFSTYGSWDEAVERFQRPFYQAVEPGPAVVSLAEKLTEGKPTEAQKIESLALYVMQEIRNVDLDLGSAGYRCTPAGEVLANRYGDPRDKAVLLVSLLRSLGITAYPALWNQEQVPVEVDIPALTQFDRVLVRVGDPESRAGRFLDPFADECRFGYLRKAAGEQALVVLDEETRFMTVPLPDRDIESATVNVMRAALAEDGSIEGEFECRPSGYFDYRMRRWLQDLLGERREKELSKAVNGVLPGAVVDPGVVSDLRDLTVPASLTQHFGDTDFALRQRDVMVLSLPEFPYSVANLHQRPAGEDRRLPIQLPEELRIDYSAEVKLPRGAKVLALPTPEIIENSVGTFSTEMTYDEAEHTIMYHQRIETNTDYIEPEDYTAYKSALDRLTIPASRLVLLEVK